MPIIYFDVTDIVHYATRYSRLTGIQRVQLCISNLLARKYGGELIRCVYYDYSKKAFYEYDPNERSIDFEMDAEVLLFELGIVSPSSIFPTKAQVKSYLRRYSSKSLRAINKLDIYLSALLFPSRLKKLGVEIRAHASGLYKSVPISRITNLPKGSFYVCMGSSWLHPIVEDFAKSHYVNGVTFVQLVHDLIPISHPQYFTLGESKNFSTWLKASLKYTSKFITVSHWTAKELAEFAALDGHSVTPKAIGLAHEFIGFERRAAVPAQPEFTFLADKQYVLCVGTIEHRKNGIALLKAWQLLIDEFGGSVPRLIFAGKYGRGGAEFEKYLLANHLLASYVEVIHSVSDQALAWLYSNCLFTAMPSLTEGWGLPIGESAWFGKVCVTSNVTSMPEVCGEFAEYIDPLDVSNIHACVRRLILDPAYRIERERQIAAIDLRCWDDVAEEIRGAVLSVNGV